MEIVYERVAAIDVGKKEVAVTVRVPGQTSGTRAQQTRKFRTFYQVLRQMVGWLVDQGVTHVAMEATGVYWKPVFHALCEADTLEVVLVNARHVKNVPGRKTDVKDSEWLAQLLECGLLRGSFIPPKEIAAIRELTRYRKKTIQARTRELQRLSKVLEDAGIKIDSVASSITTLSARDMIEALIAGERDPRVLANLARGTMRTKIPDLAMACAGRFADHHALLARMHLDHIDHLTSMIDGLDERIEQVLAPFAPQLRLLRTIPGIGNRAAQVLISELGVDMSRFPTAAHLSAVPTNVHRVLARPDDASRRCRPREDARYELRAAPCEAPPGSRDHPGNVCGHRTSVWSACARQQRVRLADTCPGAPARATPRFATSSPSALPKSFVCTTSSSGVRTASTISSGARSVCSSRAPRTTAVPSGSSGRRDSSSLLFATSSAALRSAATTNTCCVHGS